MKKVILFPKTDTVIICLPEEWVGLLVKCTLTPISDCIMNIDELEFETEKIITYRNKKRRKKN